MSGENKSQTAVSAKNTSANSRNTKLYSVFVKYWLPVIILPGIIYWLSSATFTFGHTSEFIFPVLYSLFPRLSTQSANLILALIRAFAHIVEYFFLGLLLSRFFYPNFSRIWNLRWSVLIILLVGLLALGDEIHQSFVPMRRASSLDVILDVTGGFLSQVAMMLRKKDRS